MIAGYITAAKVRDRGTDFSFVQNIMMIAVYILVLIMGLRMGINEQIINELGTIGLKSLVITAVIIAGSMAAIFIVRKAFGLNRQGKLVDSCEEATEKSSSKAELKSTVIILALVAAGMAAGHYIIAGRMSYILEQFSHISEILLIVWLCILLAMVGFDMGLSGNILKSLKEAGIKVMVFPFAAVSGSIISGVIICAVFGFTVKEGVAISAGFGWYTYAPTVISQAGEQYMMAGAVSFMHNVIRETAGIIFIPFLAKKFGYIEATGVPGVAAMDVCMPIVEKSCGRDTVIYSFTTGLLMCIVTSLAVPLAMGM